MKRSLLLLALAVLVILGLLGWRYIEVINQASQAQSLEACSNQAKKVYDGALVTISKIVFDSASVIYSNHYNSAQKKCFILVSYTDTLHQQRFDLYNAYENTVIANYIIGTKLSADGEHYEGACTMNGVLSSCSFQDFSKMVNSDMEKVVLH